MKFVEAKCTNCGAPIKVDRSKDADICTYCGSAFIVEKAINLYKNEINITNSNVVIQGGMSDEIALKLNAAGTYIKMGELNNAKKILSSLEYLCPENYQLWEYKSICNIEDIVSHNRAYEMAPESEKERIKEDFRNLRRGTSAEINHNTPSYIESGKNSTAMGEWFLRGLKSVDKERGDILINNPYLNHLHMNILDYLVDEEIVFAKNQYKNTIFGEVGKDIFWIRDKKYNTFSVERMGIYGMTLSIFAYYDNGEGETLYLPMKIRIETWEEAKKYGKEFYEKYY